MHCIIGICILYIPAARSAAVLPCVYYTATGRLQDLEAEHHAHWGWDRLVVRHHGFGRHAKLVLVMDDGCGRSFSGPE